MKSIYCVLLNWMCVGLVACQLHEPEVGVPVFIRSAVESVPDVADRNELKSDYYSMKPEFGDLFLPLRSAVESAPIIEKSYRLPLRDAVESSLRYINFDEEDEFKSEPIVQLERFAKEDEPELDESDPDYKPPPYRVGDPFQEIVELRTGLEVMAASAQHSSNLRRWPADTTRSGTIDYKIICFVTNWANYRKGDGRFVPENLDPNLCTHGIYAYASLDPQTLTMKPFDPWIDVTNNLYRRATSVSEKLPFLLALGGWTDSTGDKYSRLVSDPMARKNFIARAIPFLKEYGFKGLHVDWNYPRCWQSDCKKGPLTDRPNFTKFIKELHEAFSSEDLLVGVSLSGYKEVIEEAYDVTELSKYVEYFTVMTYDYHGAWEPQTGHVSPLYGKKGDKYPQYNTDYTIQMLLRLGASREKLVLGVPFYGQSFLLSNNFDGISVSDGVATSGPGDAGEYTKQPGMLAYSEICLRVKKQHWVVGRDPQDRSGPHANNRNQWVGYEDPRSIEKKAKYVVDTGLGGMVSWTTDLDDFMNLCCSGPFPLLRAVNEILGRVKPPKYSANDCSRPSGAVTPAAVEMTTPTDNGIPGGGGGGTVVHEHTTWPSWSATSTTKKPISTDSTSTQQTWWPTTSTTERTTPSTTQQTWWPTSSTTVRTTTARPTTTTTRSTTTTPLTTTTRATTTTTRATTTTTRATTTTVPPNWNNDGTTIPNPVNHRPVVLEGEKCDHTEYRPDPENCNSYYRCILNELKKQYCPGGLHYNSRIQQCDWPQGAKCTINSPSIITTTTYYYNEPITTRRTTSATTTTTTERSTTQRSTAQQSVTQQSTTQRSTRAPTTTTTTNPPQPITQRPTKRPNKKEKCKSGQYYPHDECERFSVCVNGHLVSNQCGPGQQWHQEALTCEVTEKVRCISKKDYIRWANLKVDEAVLRADDPCDGHDFVAYPSDCSQYLRCIHGRLEAQSCPNALHWNAKSLSCDWPSSAHCTPSQSTDFENSNSIDEVTSKPTTTTTLKPRPATPPPPPAPEPVDPLSGYYKLVCYFTNWAWYRPGLGKYTPDSIDTDLCTHIVYGFAVLDYTELTIRTHDSWADIDNKFYERVVAQKEKGVKVSLALGGWNDSQGDKYSRLVRNQASRAKFIRHAIGFIEKYGFDGLDLDWEYPVCWQVDCKKGYADEKEGFADLVRELSAEFKPRGLLLSTAVSPSKMVIDAGYDVPTLAENFDWIAVMTYDYHGQWDKKTGHVAPLFQHPDDDISYFNSNFSLHYWMEKGAPARKLVMGMPLYGQSFTLSDQRKTGLNSQAPGPGTAGEFTRAAGFLAYYEICDRVQNRQWEIVQDARGRMGPYAFSGNQWVSFDDQNMLRKKSQLVRELNLGGGMVWALDLDDFNNRCGQGKHPLLKTIRDVLKDPPRKNETPVHLEDEKPAPQIDNNIEHDFVEVSESAPEIVEQFQSLEGSQENSPSVVTDHTPHVAAVENDEVLNDVDEVEEEFKVVCYFTNWAWYRQGGGKFVPEDIDADLCSHIVYGFAVLNRDSLTIKPHDSWADMDNKFYERVVAYKKKGIKVTLAIGGWNDSAGDKYSRLVRSAEARAKFIKHVIEFLEKYSFDGLDLDWEYPVCWQVDCKKGMADEKIGFADLVRELSAEFKPRGWLLSAAVSPSQKVIDAGYDVPTLSQYFDWIAVMAYDFHGQWDKQTGHVAPMYEHPDDFDKTFNANYTIHYWISQGADRKKLIMGMPLYGQSFSLADNLKNTLNSPTYGGGEAGEATRSRGFLSYYEICHNIQNKNWNIVRDGRGRMGPYAYLRDQWVSFDDIPMIRHKSEYVAAMELGGAMVWALDLDDFKNNCGCETYPLLKTINRVLRDYPGKQPKCLLEGKVGAEQPHTTLAPKPVTTTLTTTTPRPWTTTTQTSTARTTTQQRETTQKPTTARPVQSEVTPQITEADSDDLCQENTFKAHKFNCNKYYQCHYGHFEEYGCPEGLHWKEDHCDWPQDSGCIDGIERPTTTTTRRPTTTFTPRPSYASTLKPKPPVTPIEVIYDRPSSSSDYKMVCYFTNWAWYRQGDGKYTPDDIDTSLCTHIVYGFAVLNGETLTMRTHDSWADIDNRFYERVTELKAKGVRVVLAIGGWNDSAGDKYSRLVRDPAARARFIKHAATFIEKYGFEGLDLDWEYPVCWQVECEKGFADEKDGFAALVRELSAEFKPRGWFLSAAVSPSKKVIDAGYDVPEMAKYMDWIAVMTYDFHGHWDKKTGHVAPLFYYPNDEFDYFNANFSLNYWMEKGAPAKKLIMGMPLYGQSFSLADTSKRGLNERTYGPGEAGQFTRAGGFLAYYEICEKVNRGGWNVVRDPEGRIGPYATSGSQWVSYDDVEDIRRKTRFLKSLGLGGGMIWALDLDDFRGRCGCGKHPLLRTINQELYGLPGQRASDCT